MKYRELSILTISHLCTDLNQGILPALLPILITAHNLNYEAAANLVFAANITSSVVQPLFGYYADRISAFWVMPAGLFLAGLGLAAVGIVQNYWLLFLAVALSGLGIAAFHPEAARLANYVSGEKKATGVSTFTAGGNIGFAIGPVFVIATVTIWGLTGTLFFILPATVVALILFAHRSRLSAAGYNKAIAKAVFSRQPDEWYSFFRLTLAVSLRSVIIFGIDVFVPLYWIHVLHQSNTAGSAALTILFVVGAVSSLIAGRLADYFGQIRVVRVAFLFLAPLLPLFFHTRNVVTATVLLVPIGVAIFASFSPMVVLGQKYLPNNMGLASGITLGLALSIGGVAAPFLGRLADSYGLENALTFLGLLPILAVPAAFSLPSPQIDQDEAGRQKERLVISGS
ncbi:Hypothetical protein LUCI_4387 [Lucifera butyrica]|uniref:Major facilitator superfamily (MFS) profile domain-containing protein n=1 Tax=Lucifera butyrica TaxID=1351585 RepID=A0A498RCG7_9FIRM|nr:MFS transporter [Lucifera butyrica]VBB09101.1 Hypothetical protein LUCI_4387 [Lucifera butyrica]